MKKTTMLCNAAVACASLAFPAVGRAARFGDAGTLAPNGGVQLDRNTVSPADGDSETTTAVVVAPHLQYFVVDNLAIGAGLTLTRVNGADGDYTSTAYGIAPSIAYNINLADNVSLLPTATLAYMAGSSNMTVGETEMDSSGSTISIGLAAPFLLHFNNFFIGAGPYFQTSLNSKLTVDGVDSDDAPKATSMGLTSLVGGWF